MQPRPAQDALFWLLLPAQRRPAALNPTANGAARGRPERILAGYPAPPPGTVFRNSIPSGAHSSGPRPQDRVGRSAEPVNPQSSGLRLSTSSRPCVNRAPEQGQAVICLRNMQWKASFLLSLMSIALEYCSWKLHGVYGGKGWQKILWIHLFQRAARMKKFCVAFMSGSCVFRMTRMRDHPCQRF
ncbi:uncharacterized protein [Triticum aestivum]|uniref:uncharacterized protein isoform X2 n=1 Tax=Triticum aestivum TaxID=4565 RepID=UPI001D002DDD|nr:uncharacterized protein LOC123063439 isoform X2 [Triticum aestivum]